LKSPSSLKKALSAFFHSIRFRLLAWFTAILVLIMVVFNAFIYFNQVRDLQDDSLGRLSLRLTGMQAELRLLLRQQDGQLVLPDNLFQETDVFILASASGQVLASRGTTSAQDAARQANTVLRNRPGSREPSEDYIAWVDKDTGYGFVAVPIFVESGQASLAILGSPLDPSGRIRTLTTNLLLGSLITLVIALGGGFWLADRAMRPVLTITHTARTISETDLSRRINLEGSDEIGELARTFDNMLARLQAAFERQRQFVADASHELRTPLTIVGLETSRALAARRSQSEYERALRIIHSENDLMSHLVNDLLTLARMDNGQVPLEKAPLDLSEVSVDAIERLTPLAARNKVTLETGDLPEAVIQGDRQSLLQMVSNLIENAIKYTQGDDKRVRIETGVTDGCAWVRVIDNGPGIAPEHLPHLFDRFYRVDRARARSENEDSSPESAPGSGLGLSIIQWIAQAHGAEVRVQSTPGQGSMFEVRFDRSMAHEGSTKHVQR
jgi:heavy metal sensor kinase